MVGHSGQQDLKSFDSVRAGNPRTSHSRISYDLLMCIQCWTPHPWFAQRRTSQDLPREGSALKDPQYQSPPLQEFRETPVERLTIALRVRCVRKKRSSQDSATIWVIRAPPFPQDAKLIRTRLGETARDRRQLSIRATIDSFRS